MKYLNYKSKAKTHDGEDENILKIYTLYYITHKSLSVKGKTRKTYTQTQM